MNAKACSQQISFASLAEQVTDEQDRQLLAADLAQLRSDVADEFGKH
jgi:hypothetical protein